MMPVVNNISMINDVISENIQIESGAGGVVSLDDRLIRSMADFTANTERTKELVMKEIENHVQLTPEALINLQEKVLNYNVEVSLVSAVARKAVGAVENLMRS